MLLDASEREDGANSTLLDTSSSHANNNNNNNHNVASSSSSSNSNEEKEKGRPTIEIPDNNLDLFYNNNINSNSNSQDNNSNSNNMDRSAMSSTIDGNKADKESQERAILLRETIADVSLLQQWDLFTFTKLKAILDHQMMGSYEVPNPEIPYLHVSIFYLTLSLFYFFYFFFLLLTEMM